MWYTLKATCQTFCNSDCTQLMKYICTFKSLYHSSNSIVRVVSFELYRRNNLFGFYGWKEMGEYFMEVITMIIFSEK